MARGDNHNFDSSNLSGFTATLFEVLNRFRDEAIDAHIDSGGDLDEFTAHIPGVVDGDQLINHFEPPVVMSVLSDFTEETSTTAKMAGQLNMEVAVFYWDSVVNEAYGSDNAIRLLSLVVSEVDDARTLTDKNDTDPLADDISMGTLDNDHRFAQDGSFATYWASTTFTVEFRRTKPT